MTPAVLNHPRLGALTRSHSTIWSVQPQQVGAFGHVVEIELETTNSRPPNENQLTALVELVESSTEFKDTALGYLLEEYQTSRPQYLKTIGNANYRQSITVDDVPEIDTIEEIWQVVEPLQSVSVDEDGMLTLCFAAKFDDEHTFTMRLEGLELYDCVLEE